MEFQKTVEQICNERNDEFEIKGRIEFARDLHAADAVYQAFSWDLLLQLDLCMYIDTFHEQYDQILLRCHLPFLYLLYSSQCSPFLLIELSCFHHWFLYCILCKRLVWG
jgi:hypothetical protein